MSMFATGTIGIVAFLLLLAFRAPIALAMAGVGLVGAFYINGWASTMFVVGSLPFSNVFPYSLSVVPLFILMGSLALHTGMSRNLYDFGYAAFGQLPGGLSMGTIAACAGFGAICGSSLATAATMGRISIPEMKQRGYDTSFSVATVAAGGTLGVLIPPSIILVIYALLTEQSIGRLFVAAVIPGLLATVLYIFAIAASVRMKPSSAPRGDRMPLAQRLRLAASAWPVLIVFTVVLGGLFVGIFSPTEAASVGVLGVAGIAIMRRRLDWTAMKQVARETAGLTGMIFMILIGAAMFNYFIEATQITSRLVGFVSEAGFSTPQIVIAILVFYIILGCFMDSVSMVFLTIPFVFPIVVDHGLDPIWFGILLLSVVEIGLITPPVGMNLFVVKTVVPELPMSRIYSAIVPFLVADFIRLTLIASFPVLSLFLVKFVYT